MEVPSISWFDNMEENFLVSRTSSNVIKPNFISQYLLE